MKKTLYGVGYFLKKFFVNYVWLGISIVLIGALLDAQYPTASRSFYTSAFISLLTTIGISVLVASIFSFASSTYDFVEKIRGLLEDIIVKRNFLRNIDPEGKKEALKSLIQPSVSEANKYPNIGDYYGHFINKTLEISKRSVRSNYQINARAYKDNASKRITVEAIYSYRLYPSSEGYKDIELGFQKDGNDGSYCEYLSLWTPDGKRHHFDADKLLLAEQSENGDIVTKATIPISTIGKGFDRIDVELKAIEFGKDHWILYPFKALQPTDGFKFHLHCEDGITVQHHCIFVVDASYYFDISDDATDVSVTCNQWINEGSGLTILASIPETHRTNSGTVSQTPENDGAATITN